MLHFVCFFLIIRLYFRFMSCHILVIRCPFLYLEMVNVPSFRPVFVDWSMEIDLYSYWILFNSFLVTAGDEWCVLFANQSPV